MEFAFGEGELMFQRELRRYAAERLAPLYSRWEQEPIPRELLREFGELGLMGLRVPVEYGGQEASFVMCGIAGEEIGRGDFNVTAFIQLHAIVAESMRGASPEQKRRWLPAIASGQAVAAFAITEPGAGSDAAHITTRAVRDGNHYVINGEKSSITFAGIADLALVFVRTGGEGARGISNLIVPLDLPGISRAAYNSPGGKATQRGSLFFDNVSVPVENLVGEEGRGFYDAMNAFDFNRAIIGLCCLGAAEQSLAETAEYLKGRQAFGRSLASFEGTSFQLAEHLTLVEAARLLCYEALWLKDQGLPHTKEAAMAKWLAPKVSAEAIHACMILHGHYGYNKDSPLEQRLRDVIGLEIGDGTPEIMKLVIARETLGREYLPY